MIENIKNTPSPSQLETTEPVPRAGFAFLLSYGDKMGNRRKYIIYKPAKVHRAAKSFFYFSYKNPGTNKFVRYRVYGQINRIKDPKDLNEYIKNSLDALNQWLDDGGNPFEQKPVIVVKNWTVVQGLNFFKQNLPNRGLRKRTQQTYGSVLTFLYAYLPMNEPIKELSKIQVNATFRKAYLDKKWSNVTFNNYITLTKAIWNYLIEEEITDNNPVKVKPLPENITKHKYFSDEVFKKIKEKSPADLLRFIMFLYHTGTRPNEARQLKYEHILRDRKLLFIPASISKNKKDDYVPLSEYILKNYKGEGFIFHEAINYYGRKFNELKTELKLSKDHTLYSIKHSRALHLANDGADPYSIMQLFRHSGLHITMAYLRDLNVNINREAVEKGIKF